jgi:hypothetical protein
METMRRELGERTWASTWAWAAAMVGAGVILLLGAVA